MAVGAVDLHNGIQLFLASAEAFGGGAHLQIMLATYNKEYQLSTRMRPQQETKA